MLYRTSQLEPSLFAKHSITDGPGPSAGGACHSSTLLFPKGAVMPGQNQLDAIALLKSDNRKVEDLFAKFEATKGAANKQTLVRQICTELSAHTVIEEEIFYPACRGQVEEGLLNEGYVEHDGSKVLIAELLASALSEEFYDAKVKVLSEQIEHHVHEEERRSDGIFSQARAAGLDMEDLGDRLRARKDAILAEYKSSGIPAPETRTFTGHTLEQGEPVDENSAGW
jgi:hemerythrin superfamily protein